MCVMGEVERTRHSCFRGCGAHGERGLALHLCSVSQPAVASKLALGYALRLEIHCPQHLHSIGREEIARGVAWGHRTRHCMGSSHAAFLPGGG